jgi:hypothetical protein
MSSSYVDRYKVPEPLKYGPLKDCPFCGSAAAVMRPMGARLKGDLPPFYGVPYYRVTCSIDGCFCSGPANILLYLAVRAWNTRAGDELRFYRAGIKAGAEYMFKEWDDEDAQLHREAIRALPDPTPEQIETIRKGEAP